MSRSLHNLRRLISDQEARVWDLLVQLPRGQVRERLLLSRNALKAALNEVDEQIEAAEEARSVRGSECRGPVRPGQEK